MLTITCVIYSKRTFLNRLNTALPWRHHQFTIFSSNRGRTLAWINSNHPCGSERTCCPLMSSERGHLTLWWVPVRFQPAPPRGQCRKPARSDRADEGLDTQSISTLQCQSL